MHAPPEPESKEPEGVSRMVAWPVGKPIAVGVTERAFVTGATGLLGSNLVDALLRAGFEVRALVRSKDKAARVFGNAKVDVVVGDMADVAGFALALSGCGALFHTAAYFREYY